MGLDISAFEKLELDETIVRYGYPYEYVLRIYANEDFPDRQHPLVDGKFYRSATQRFAFYAGSYHGYNYWRNELSMLSLGVPAKMVWRNQQEFIGKPFYELIYFSDCEGVIGSTVSKKLAKDFANFQDKADTHPDEGFREKYYCWRKAFEIASNGGAVDFH